MVRGHRELAMKYRVNIRHITEQSCHNKVLNGNGFKGYFMRKGNTSLAVE